MERQSYAEFVLGTYNAMIVDIALQYPELTKELNRDLQRLRSAINDHGIRFALDTMPAFRKHFDKCLAKRRLTRAYLIHFGSDKKGGLIPRLFRGLILRVFDRNGGLRLQPDVEAIRHIRQLLGAFRKLRLTSNLKDTGNAVIEFIKLDEEVRLGNLKWDSVDAFNAYEGASQSFTDLQVTQITDDTDVKSSDPSSTPDFTLLKKVQQTADLLTSLVGHFDPMEWKPRHGPGAVSDRSYGSYKYEFDNWPERLERVFPYADFACANYANVDFSFDSEEAEQRFHKEYPARLCAVPKTLSTPRLIAAEPISFQWCQQVVRDFLYTRVERTFIGNFIDFRRQELNGDLAMLASHDGSRATIDLSSASDRISCWHVERLFRRSPSLLSALQASRSASIEQGICRFSERLISLRKYSTMGNATTFPVQSLFFLSLALASVLYVRKLPVNFRNLKALGTQQVRVFGDDIIVPADASGVLVELIEALSLRVNPAKTFLEGNFRESCGVDAFSGYDVTTVNILDVPRRAGPGSIVSTVDVHNNLVIKGGYLNTALFLQKTARRLGYEKIRIVKHGSGSFGWNELAGGVMPFLKKRYNRALQIVEVYCLRTKVREQRLPATSSAGLLQFFTEAAKVVTSNTSSLGYTTRRPKASLSLGWVPLV